MTGSATAAVRSGQVVRVALTLHLGQLVAKAFIVHFAIDRAFIHPCLRPVLRQVAQYAKTHPAERLVILGHTDRVGDDPYNQSLSERRVRTVFAALTYGANPTAAVAEWDRIRRSRPAGETPSIREGRGGWGTPEYQYILQDLGYYSGPVDGRHRSITDAAVRAFQVDRGLQVDGNVGNQTWSVLIDAYLAQDALSIPDAQWLRNALNGCDGGSLKWLGCGEQMFLSTTPSAPCAPDVAWRPNRRVELLFVQTDRLPCEIPRPDTFGLPTANPVGSTWCLGPGNPDARCCFVTHNPQEQDKWLIQPAEPGTVRVRGSIQFEDGTPLANAEYVIIAPDGEYMDGERHCGEQRGQAIPGRTGADGSFDYPTKPKGIGIYTLEINGLFLARLAGEPPEVAKGNVVCKRLDGTTNFNVVVVRHPGDPSEAGPFQVGEDEYVEGTFDIPPISGQSHRRITITLRALVRYPAQRPGHRTPVSTQATTYPLVLIAHGHHPSERGGVPIHSYEGLEYLARHLASYGYIAVSIDHNDFNRANLGEVHRALGILRHIEVMAQKNLSDPRLQGKIDLDHIVPIGHSRGGLAAVLAQQINVTENRGHRIQALVAIAPTSQDRLQIPPTPILILLGAADGDVGDNPARLYSKVSSPKSMIYIYGAIHNFFNTHPDWVRPGGTNFGERNIARNDSRVIRPQDHLNLAKGYSTAFLELILRQKTAYKPYFNRYQRPNSVAGIEVHHQFQDSNPLNVDDFEQDPKFVPRFDRNDPPQNTLGFPIEFANLVNYEEWFQFSNGTHVGYIRWNRQQGLVGPYRTLLRRVDSEPRNVTSFKVLSFRVALEFENNVNLPIPLASSLNPPHQPQSLTVFLVDSQGKDASVATHVITRIPYPYLHHDDLRNGEFSSESETILKTIRIPLSLFQSRNPNLDLTRLEKIGFEFNQTPSGNIAIDSIEFSM